MTEALITLSNGTLEASFAEIGAEMQSLKLNGTEVLWHGDPAWWSGRAPLLFPIVGPSPTDTLRMGDFEAEMIQHGFARRSAFEVVEQGADHVTQVLRANDATRAQYPFEFELRVTRRLTGATLEVMTEVRNAGDTPMPFCFGYHPAFLWPLPGAEGQPHGVTLDNGGTPALARIANKRLQDARSPSPFENGALVLDHSQFEDDAMIFPEGAGAGLRYGVEGGPGLQFTFHNLPHLAIWQKPGAPYVCIEPWHGTHTTEAASNEITERPGCITLPAGESQRFGYEVTVTL